MSYSVDNLHLLTLNVGLAHHQADWNWKNVRSPFARLYYVTEGTAHIVLPQGTYVLQPDHLYLIPAYTTHSYICDSLFTHYYIHIYEDLHAEESILDGFDFPIEVKGTKSDLEMMKRLCDMNPFLKLPLSNPQVYDNHPTLINNLQLNLRRPYADRVESRGILYILMSRFLRYAKPKTDTNDNHVLQAMTFIRKNLANNVKVSTVARHVCISEDHFIRIFKRETGITPNAYIAQCRQERTEQLLITTDMPIKAIATTLGFEDYSYFNKLFKKNTGITPQQYRRNHFEK